MSNYYYKGIRVNAFGIPVSKKSHKSQNQQISKSSNNFPITKKQLAYYNSSFNSPFQKSSPKNLILMYDIPENQKKERDWFRRHLIRFGYVMIQKSVWVGPSPLPKDFLEYLKEIKIGDKLKTFKLAKSYNSSISAIA